MNVPYVTVVRIGLSAKTHENMLLQGEDLPLPELKKITAALLERKIHPENEK